MPSQRTTSMRTNMQDVCKRGAQAQSVLENAWDTSRRSDKTRQDSGDGAGFSWGGTNEHNTRIIMAYNPCKNKNVNSGTLYQQQRWYFITRKKDLTCPLILFRRDLIKQLQKWQEAREKITLFMDYDEHMTKGALGKALGDRDGLDLQEAIIHHTGKSPGATYFRGSKPIDSLWISSDIEISNACVMPFVYGVGDHCAFVLDVPIKLLVGIDLVKIVCPASQRVKSRLPGCSKAYIDSPKGNITRHCLLEWLHKAHTRGYLAEEMAQKVIKIDKEGKAYMRHAEKMCTKIKSCCIAFLPEASIWIRRVQVYYLLLWYHNEKIKNRGNLKQAARRCNIPNLLSLSIQEFTLCLETCKRECAFYQEHGKRFHRQHLKNRK